MADSHCSLPDSAADSVITRFTDVDAEIVRNLSQRFIAFDVETTGLHTHTDRIVEIGAVLFENGEPVSTFSTLVNPGISMPEKATEICHITNEMLSAAPSEKQVYPELLRFLGDALTCGTFMCAHNARFDLDMLRHTLVRLGYQADIRYVDTLKLSWRCLPGMPTVCFPEGNNPLLHPCCQTVKGKPGSQAPHAGNSHRQQLHRKTRHSCQGSQNSGMLPGRYEGVNTHAVESSCYLTVINCQCAVCITGC